MRAATAAPTRALLVPLDSCQEPYTRRLGTPLLSEPARSLASPFVRPGPLESGRAALPRRPATHTQLQPPVRIPVRTFPNGVCSVWCQTPVFFLARSTGWTHARSSAPCGRTRVRSRAWRRSVLQCSCLCCNRVRRWLPRFGWAAYGLWRGSGSAVRLQAVRKPGCAGPPGAGGIKHHAHSLQEGHVTRMHAWPYR